MHHPSTPDPARPLQGSVPRPDTPASPASITALVSRCTLPFIDLLPCPEHAAVGDVVGLVTCFRASVERRKVLEPPLEGALVQTPHGPAVRSCWQIAGRTKAGLVVSKLSLDHLSPRPDIHDIVTDDMAPIRPSNLAEVVAFADARITLRSAALTCVAGGDADDRDGGLNMRRPLVVEVPVGLGEAEALALAERRVSLVRQLLRPEVDFTVEIAGYELA